MTSRHRLIYVSRSVLSDRGSLVLALVGALGLAAPAAGALCEENTPVEDVLQAFDNLTHHGEWLGFHNGAVGAPLRVDYTSTNHFQGIVRSPGAGTPYFFVSSAGSWSDDVSDANLMVVELGSRDESGERLRSNRLLKGKETSCTLPPLTDIVVKSVPFRDYRHPGGMQMVGDILAVPLEQPGPDWDRCYGGSNHGASCLSHCPDGGVCTQFCYDGSNHGNPCTDDSECPDGGVCKVLCQGGINHGKSCECPGGVCTDVCDGGSNDGGPCDFDDDCPGGSCVGLPGGRVLFYDMSNPKEPDLIHTLDIYDTCVPDSLFCAGGSNNGNPCSTDSDCHGGGTCKIAAEGGFAGFTRLPDDHFLVMVGMKAGKYVAFWRSNYTSFSEPGFKFEFHDSWHASDLEGDKFCVNGSNEGKVCTSSADCPDGGCVLEEWPTGTTAAQNYSLVNQEDGRLFMIAGRNLNPLTPLAPAADRLIAYEILGFEPGQLIEIIQRRPAREVSFVNDSSLVQLLADFVLLPNMCAALPTAETMNGNLLAGGSAYVSPSGELLFYAVNHYHDGPYASIGDQPIARMSELRHINVVRDPEPFHTVARAGGPYVVDEGSTILLDGSLSQAHKVGPWAQLFDGKDFAGQSVMFDWADREKDDYSNFTELDGEAVINDCVDLEALAAVTAAGKQIYDTARGLTEGNFYNEACLGILTEDGCWEVVPGWVIDGACVFACDVAYEACDLVCDGVCLVPWECCSCCRNDCDNAHATCAGLCGLIWDPGVEALSVAVPNFTSPAWTVLTAIDEVLILSDPLIASIFDDYCGKELPDDIWTPPSPPDSLQALNPATWPWTGDPLKFWNDFPGFVSDLGTAVADLVQYAGDFLDYLEYLVASLEGFNNRASSVRWCAPNGADIILYEDVAHSGGRLVLQGNGSIQSYSDLSDQDLTTGVDADNRVRSMEFSSTYNEPTLDSHTWSIVSPNPPDPFALHDAMKLTPTFDASSGDGPASVEVELVVTDSLGEIARATAIVTVLNVTPEASIDRIEDQTGVGLDGPMPVLLEALEYALVGSFTDAGIPDTHTADVSWGDGSMNTSADSIFQFADSFGGATGAVRVPHTYASKGTYFITLTVEDDDGASTQATQDILVVDAAGATQISADLLLELLDNFTPAKDAARALRKAVSKLQGNNNGAANNGALHHFEREQWNAALEKIKQTLEYLSAAIEADPSLTDSIVQVQRLLALAAKSVVIQAATPDAEAEEEAEETTRGWHRGKGKATQADRYLELGDQSLAAGDYTRAVSYYQRAQRAVQGGN